jgi:hypothetical protein
MVAMTLSVGMVYMARMAYMAGKVGMARLKCRVSVRGAVGVVDWVAKVGRVGW